MKVGPVYASSKDRNLSTRRFAQIVQIVQIVQKAHCKLCKFCKLCKLYKRHTGVKEQQGGRGHKADLDSQEKLGPKAL